MRRLPHLPLALFLLIPCSGWAQDSANVYGPADAEGYQLLDRVEIVANTDSVTRLRLQRIIKRNLALAEVTTEEEFQVVQTQTIRQQVQHLLMRQAGEDLGFDPEVVQHRARELYRDRVDRTGGVSDMLAQLRAEDSTQVEEQEEIEGELYTSTWRRAVLGQDAGPGGRPAADRFVRPGTKRRVWERMRKTGDKIELLREVGAQPASYELQILLLAGQMFAGGVREARDKALEFHQALEEGVIDWEQAIAEGALRNRGLTGPLDREMIARGLDPGDGSLLQFVLEGDTEALSAVLPYPLANPATGEIQIQGFAIYRLLGSQPAQVPGFTEPGVQKELTANLQWARDNERFMIALNELEASAYVWYPGIEEEREAQKAQIAEQERAILETREENAEREKARKAAEEEKEPPAEEPPAEEEPPPTGEGT